MSNELEDLKRRYPNLCREIMEGRKPKDSLSALLGKLATEKRAISDHLVKVLAENLFLEMKEAGRENTPVAPLTEEGIQDAQVDLSSPMGKSLQREENEGIGTEDRLRALRDKAEEEVHKEALAKIRVEMSRRVAEMDRRIESPQYRSWAGDLHLKKGVRLAGLRAEMMIAVLVMKDACRAQGVLCVIASANDGQHSRASLHWQGGALDFGTRGMHSPGKAFEHARGALGGDFDVVLEADHIHVEFHPKAP